MSGSEKYVHSRIATLATIRRTELWRPHDPIIASAFDTINSPKAYRMFASSRTQSAGMGDGAYAAYRTPVTRMSAE